MDTWKRRALGYLVLLAAAIVLTAKGYQIGMRVYEGRPRTFLDSLQFAVEMFTTTGFGGDSPWESAEMHLFITVTDLLGMVLLVGALPVFVAPLVESALSTTAPSELETALTNHIVICSNTTRADELIRELEANDIPYVIVESNRERADKLYEAGKSVICADPESVDGLADARLPSARALFVDLSDQIDASIVLAAKELTDDIPIISVIESPEAERYHQLAGANTVLFPRSLLGESLAAKVTTAARTDIIDAVEIEDHLQLAEVSIRHGGPLVGETLASSSIGERSGANVIGIWIRGDFNSAPSPDTELIAGSVLLVSGRADQLQRLAEMAQASVRGFAAGGTVVVGYGQVGQAVSAELAEAGVPYTVIDKEDGDGVDVVGDVTDLETLAAAGIAEAETVVLALPDDTTTEFATLVIRDLAPDTQILARVEKQANISKTYRAGADYVLSLARVTGRMAASQLLEGRDVVSLKQQVKTIRQQVPALDGLTIREANIRGRTGCTVVAIKREEDVVSDIGPDTAIHPGDELVVVGTDEGINAFEQEFQSNIK
ncbi:TrkA family potassium uptake protein (plasmid) [Halorubrum sp. BOL3-1]|uniref:potassium channel family protein n=1 Tax=Halorubrum sp. BOL3-1 TaxID=2497325 RepID=UPI00100518A3|nr:NAD-binding protein [Halorubrum sp. BOL3-1]QAU14535.1 TrkA family potassium uptake protein [Halorubrum sp. BOL3-1]